MPALGAPLDFAKYEGRNLRAHQLGAAPSSPVTGQLYYNTGDNTLYFYNGTTWVAASGGTPADATAGTKGVIQLAGDLAGTAASPQIAAGVITDVDVAAANKDGAVGTPCLRTLGVGGTQAMRGDMPLQGITAPTSSVNFANQRLVSLADPISNQDAANKQYVDGLIQGLDSHPSCIAATTANIAALAGGAPNTLDGIALIVGSRVLVKDQTTTNQNGIYTVTTLGTGVNGTWARASDQDVWAEVPSAYVWVEQGTTQADTGWVCTADAGGVLGTTAITWVLFASAGTFIAGAGLTKTGNVIDVGAGAGISVAADTVAVATGGVTNAMLAGAIDVTTKLTGAVPLANGGTGQITAKAARETGLGSVGYYSSATHGAGAVITITQATHGLRASRGIQIQVQDEATGNVEIPDLSVAANGDVTVTYGASVTANSKRVTLVG